MFMRDPVFTIPAGTNPYAERAEVALGAKL